MTRDDFTSAIQVMVDALPTQGEERRSRALYEFFGDKPIDRVRYAARIAAHELDRFPTPKTFGEIFQRTAPKESEEVRAECHFCDGYGRALVDGVVYRGRCEHGDRLSSKISKAPEYFREPGPLTDERLVEMMAPDPVKFIKGLSEVGGTMKKMKPELYARVRKLALELVGLERAKQIVEEHKREKQKTEEFFSEVRDA